MDKGLLMTIVILLSVFIVFSFAILFYKKMILDKKIDELRNLDDEVLKAQIKAKDILEQAERDALSLRKSIELEAKETIYTMKEEAEKDIKAAKAEILQKEARVSKKEESLDAKFDKLEIRSHELEKIAENLEIKNQEADAFIAKQEVELQKIAGLSKAEAMEIFMVNLKNSLTQDSAVAIKEFERKLEDDKDRISKRILSSSISKAAAEYVVDATVSVVNLPNDEMKGRIIGREGRNIRAIEALTGVDIIIDDTPEAIVLSSFDVVRRETARIAIEKLISDGRIHPGKIEELVLKAQKEIEKDIIEAGEAALIELGITGVHPEIVKTIGKLKYRTSYGQNILVHSIEVAKLSANIAAEIGANTNIAKRAGLFHDLGKVLDHDIETSHALIGAEFLKKFGEKPIVINAVAAHHNEVEFESIEAVLIQASDAISASRPGARRETLSTYIKRLESLEEIAKSFTGVESSYAIQAGREIRIIINPEVISDAEATIMAREAAKKIEETMQYPGQIKVTILRETRAVEYAK